MSAFRAGRFVRAVFIANRGSDTGVLIRLGRVLHWIGAGFAAALLFGALLLSASLIFRFINFAMAAEHFPPFPVHGDDWVALLLMLAPAIPIWLSARAVRYILANE